MTSVVAFTIVKTIGAAYLVYLGAKTFLDAHKVEVCPPELRGVSGRSVFWQGFLSDALNPKVAIFYLAFLPQFVDPQAHRPVLQVVLLGTTANMIALPINILIVFASSSLTQTLRRSERVSSLLKRVLGITFVGLGARLAFEKPSKWWR